MRIPCNLKHKPVIIAKDYELVDGKYAGEESDAKGLTLGLAQWNDRGKVDISGKVWRYTGEKWSRQSEELPLHRVLDLAIMTCRVKKYFQSTHSYIKSHDPRYPLLDNIPLQGNRLSVNVCTENSFIDDDVKLFTTALLADEEILHERLYVLGQALRDIGY